MNILWNTGHREFTVFDYYYYSKLKSNLESLSNLRENKNILTFKLLKKYHMAIFNYPETSFSKGEIEAIEKYVLKGGRVILCAYYQNEDGVADISSSVSKNFGITFNGDGVRDENNSLLITVNVDGNIFSCRSSNGSLEVSFPCSCSLNIENEVEVEVLAKFNDKVVAAISRKGNGCLVCLGTCVFWDNFSIEKEDNYKFVERILTL